MDTDEWKDELDRLDVVPGADPARSAGGTGGMNWSNSLPFMIDVQGRKSYRDSLDRAVIDLYRDLTGHPAIIDLAGQKIALPDGISGTMPTFPPRINMKMAEALRHILHNCAFVASHPLVVREEGQHRNACLAIPLSKQAYGPNGNGLSLRAMHHAILALGSYRPDSMHEPWLLTKKGYNTPGQTARLSRIAPSYALKSWMARKGLIFPNHPHGRRSSPSKAKTSVIWINQNNEEGDPNEQDARPLDRPLQGDEKVLPILNGMLEKRKVSFRLDDYADYDRHWDYSKGRSKIPNQTVGRVHRVFSLEDGRGGRLWGHWVQRVPSDLRPRCIRIHGQPCAELDYGAMQLVLMYAMAGIPVPEGDLYVKYGETEDRRDRMKQVLTVSVGCATRKQSLGAIRKKLQDQGTNREGKAERLYDDFWSRHPRVHPHDRDEAMWPVLQYEESRIALRVLHHLVAQRIIVIPIHDSFVVQQRHAEKLRAAMAQAFADLWPGVPINIKEK